MRNSLSREANNVPTLTLERGVTPTLPNTRSDPALLCTFQPSFSDMMTSTEIASQHAKSESRHMQGDLLFTYRNHYHRHNKEYMLSCRARDHLRKVKTSREQ